ncbi:MAG: hypothetical protein JWP22_3685 [Ramlibacter sp.]|nr:hypothetical protein [Ramlibacter sp.]
MKDRVQVRAVAAGVAVALLSLAIGSSSVLFMIEMYWMLAATGVAFVFAAAVRELMDGPDMYPRSMKAIARAADDQTLPKVQRRTAVALYLYMVSLLFAAAAFCTILLVSFVFLRQ